MCAFRRPKAIPRGVKRGRDVARPTAKDSKSAVDSAGRRTLLERNLEYAEPVAKRARQVDGCAAPHDMSSVESYIDTGDHEYVDTQLHTCAHEHASELGGVGKETKPRQINKNAPSYKMRQWMLREADILARLLAREYDDMIGTMCECGREPATTRCLECGNKAPQCVPCILRDHTHLHFHWIDRWNGRYFERVDLATLGHIIHLGHRDKPCPNLSSLVPAPASYFVITHTNGVHCCLVHYCHCAGRADQPSQLISAGFWPSSLERPETAFTQALMKQWHLDWDISHKSAQDYFRVLQRLTDNANAANVENRYREFMSASRVWRHFAMEKRAGRCHGIVLPHRKAQAITVPCFTCPWPDFNLPDDWRDHPEELQYLYRIVLGCDGNHSLHKKTKRDDPDDVSLAVDQGFFVNHEDMKEYLRESYQEEETLETCSGFKVLRSLRPGKFRFMDVSGLIGTSCKHVLFRHGGMVDMQTGERSGHAMFAIAGALRGTEALAQRGFSYDVVCIIIRNIVKRCRKYFPELVPIVEQLQMLLPKMHMYAHRDLCQIVYSFAYATGFGLTHGEGVETPWAEFNIAGLPTREMSAGARHDALTDLFNFWNWSKVERMGTYLAGKLSEAYKGQLRTTEYLAGLTALAGPDAVAEWLRIPFDNAAPTPLTFRAKEANFAHSPFLVDQTKLPSARKAYDNLLEDERQADQWHTRKMVAHLRKEFADFLMRGLDLESELLALKQKTAARKATQQGELVDDNDGPPTTSWKTWRRNVDRWRQTQAKYMPLLGVQVSSGDTSGESGDSDRLSHIPQSDTPGQDDGDDGDDDEYDDNDNEELYVDLDAPTSSDKSRPPGTARPDHISAPSPTSSTATPEVLGLPSDFSAEEQRSLQLEVLAEYEYKLRIGQAFDQLDIVRQAVKHLAAYIEEKREHSHTTKDNTRSNDTTKFSRAHCERVARRYNYIYDRLLHLRTCGGSPTDARDPAMRLKRIDLAKDLTIASLKVAREKGASTRSGSWIWWAFEDSMESDATPSPPERASNAPVKKTRQGKSTADAPTGAMLETSTGESGDAPKRAYITWFDRAQWFKAWQEKLRYDEAVNILSAEFRATIKGYSSMAQLWLAAAEREALAPGERAYAYQHHAIFERMSTDCRNSYEAARKPGVPEHVLDQTLSMQPYLKEQKQVVAGDLTPWESVLEMLRTRR